MKNWLTQTPYAHRGLHNYDQNCVENSPSAFQAALDGGFGIELDVQLSRDGEAMVFHDRGLSRLTNEKGAVIKRTADQLCDIQLKNSTDNIPTLGMVLDQIDGAEPLLVEIKTQPGEDAGPLEERVADLLDHYDGPVAVMSFAPSSVAWFANYAPDIPRGQIAMDFMTHKVRLSWKERVALTRLYHVGETQPNFVAYDIRSLPTAVTRRVRAMGVPVLTWTVRTAQDRARAAHHADQMIFEGFVPSR